MKKIISILIAVAMLIAAVPAVFAAESANIDGVVISEGTEALNSASGFNEYHDVEWTAPSNGTLYIQMGAATPGWFYTIDGVTLQITGSEAVTDSYTVESGVTYNITIGAYNPALWAMASGVVSWKLTFVADAEGGEAVKEESALSETVLTVGENHVTLLQTAVTTLYTFAPDETGVYKLEIKTEGGVMTLWIASIWSKIEDAVDGVLNVEVTAVGQSWLVGISGVDTATIVITKAGEADVYEELEPVVYENKAQLSSFAIPEGATIGEYVDVYGDTHTAVLGDDGYYHLDGADGPILLVDMDHLATLTDALKEGRGIMHVVVTDENGESIKYDIGKAAQEYMAVTDENGYYPLTEDLLFFYQVYAVNSGTPQYVLNEGYNEECAWMFACLTMTLPADAEDAGGEIVPGDANPNAGDTVIGIAVAAAIVSTMSIAALPLTKKHF